MTFPGASLFPGMGTFRCTVPSNHSSANADEHHMTKYVHPKVIDAARESAIGRSDQSLDRRLSMNCQMRTLHFHLMLSMGRSFFSYELTSRALCLTPQQMSTHHQYLTANEKAQTEGLIVPENGGFPCAIDGPRMFATDAGQSLLIL